MNLLVIGVTILVLALLLGALGAAADLFVEWLLGEEGSDGDPR